MFSIRGQGWEGRRATLPLVLARSQLLQFGFGRGQLGRALRGRLKSLRRLHERLWVRAQLLANLRIRLQVLTQCWVRFNVFLVGSQRRILGEVAGDVALVLQEFVEAGNRGAHPVAVARHTLAAHVLVTGAHTIVLIATSAKILVTAGRVVLLLVL